MSTQGFRYVVLLPAILAATWIWSSEQSYDEKLDAVMPEIPTEVLVTDAKKYLASGKFMQLDAIDGLIRETQAQAGQFGVTDAHRRCLAAFVAAVQKQGQRINRSNAARATVESLDKLQRSNPEAHRKMIEQILVLSLSVGNQLTVDHNEMDRCLAGGR